MNIAFIINRKMTLKFLKDIIDVSLEKNLNIYLLFDYVNSRHNKKWREYPSLDTFQKENDKISKITFFKYSEIEEISKKQKIDYIISIVSPSIFNIKKNNLSSKWVLLQNGIDMFHYSRILTILIIFFFIVNIGKINMSPRILIIKNYFVMEIINSTMKLYLIEKILENII